MLPCLSITLAFARTWGRSVRMKPAGLVTRVFFWLSGASDESLAECPAWERRKYVAFGATVLVPSLFAAVAAAYALSTLTDDWRVITAVSLVWAFIILTVDRALLATYRAYQNFFRKLSQFSLRIVVAALMGLSISHPLALLLFRDTIQTSIEKQRDADISAARQSFDGNKKNIESKIAALDVEIASLGRSGTRPSPRSSSLVKQCPVPPNP